jgi:hypothetical protein
MQRHFDGTLPTLLNQATLPSKRELLYRAMFLIAHKDE